MRDLTRSDTGFQVDLGRWRIEETDTLVRARGLAVTRPGQGIDVGNPHVVVALQSIEELEGLDLTVIPQLDPLPPHGANIEFVVPGDPLVRDGVGSIRMRVFERGVGETLSCGTGVAAAALAVRHWAGPAAPGSLARRRAGRDARRAHVPDRGGRARGALGPRDPRVLRRGRPRGLTPSPGRPPVGTPQPMMCRGSVGGVPCRRTRSTRKPFAVAARCTL